MSDRSAAMMRGDRSYLDLVDYLRIFRRRKAWLIGSVALGIVLALGHFFLAQPSYVSTARVLVAETNVNPLEGPSPVDLETEREVVLSTPVAALAKEEMDSNQSTSELLRNVSVEVPGDSQVLEITYSGPEARIAQKGASAFANGYLEYGRQQAQEVSRQSIETIESRIGDILAEIAALNEQIAEEAPGSEERAQAIAIRSGLRAEMESLRMQIGGLTGVSTDPGDVIGAPARPESPASPSFPIDLALGVIVGLLAGVVIALFRERTDRRIHGYLDLEQVLGVPRLAVVPHLRTWQDQDEPVLVSRDEPHNPAGEGYRVLRTHLLLASHTAGGAPQVVLVTSAFPGEGKTTTAANLGVVLAHSDKRTLVVSADFRRPRLHSFFDLPNAPGLSEVLGGTAPLKDAVRRTGVDHLLSISSGALGTDAVELLRPENIRAFTNEFAELSGGFDFLLIDAPPLLPVADTLTIVPAMDQVILVVDASRTEEPALRRSRELLEQVDAEVLGAFLNNQNPRDRDAYEANGYAYGMDGEAAGRWRIAGIGIPWLKPRGAQADPSQRKGVPGE